MTLITKGMGAILKSKKKLSVSQKAKVSAAKDKAISKIVSPRRKLYKKKFGKEPTFKMKNPITGKSETHINHMIGDKEIQRYGKILHAKTWRKR
jgi:hypothetical protein